MCVGPSCHIVLVHRVTIDKRNNKFDRNNVVGVIMEMNDY